MLRPPRPPRSLLLLLLAGALSGCLALAPRLPATPPPPNLPAGAFLVQVPPHDIEALARPAVQADRDAKIPELYGVDRERAERILSHQIVVGMSAEEVVWTFLSHPTRVRDRGPPGGHVLLWEQGRWFVRLSHEGEVVSAGRY